MKPFNTKSLRSTPTYQASRQSLIRNAMLQDGGMHCAHCTRAIEDYEAPSAQHIVPLRTLGQKPFEEACAALGIDETTVNTYQSKLPEERLALMQEWVDKPENMTLMHRSCNQVVDNQSTYTPIEAHWENLKGEHRNRLKKKGEELVDWILETTEKSRIALRIDSTPLDILFAAESLVEKLHATATIHRAIKGKEDPHLPRLTTALDRITDRINHYNYNASKRAR